MKILTAAQMQKLDRLTSERYGVPSLTLMENAGRSVVDILQARLGPLEKQNIVILCGKGNNGGDGFVVARLLRHQGLTARTLLFADPATLRGDAQANYARFATSVSPEIVTTPEAWRSLQSSLSNTTLFVDALLGTGLTKPLEGFLLEVIRSINAGFPTALVLAVDLPSGISADSGDLIGEHMRADYSVTFTAPKIGHVFPPACERMGEWTVQQIGTPLEAVESDPELTLNYEDKSDISWVGKPRPADSNKGKFGHVLIIAGSIGKTGAAAMAALAALRVGAGLVTVATPRSAVPIVSSYGMELMTEPLPETDDGSISLKALYGDHLDKLMAKKTVLAVGPGIGANAETAEFVRAIVNKYAIPLVLDADGLNAFAGRMEEFSQQVRRSGQTVFTPHPGEMSRLAGKSIAEIQASRLETAREFAKKFGITLVLKGFRTLTASPDGQVRVNPTGNPGMAKGGTGDVLTGMTAGLLAQFPHQGVGEVAAAAVYLHGLAGDIAAKTWGQQCMLAGDLVQKIPAAFKELTTAA